MDRGTRIAYFTSDRSRASDKFVLNTVFRATDRDGYRLTGVKYFCSLGDVADYFFVTGIREGKTNASDGAMSALNPSRDAA